MTAVGIIGALLGLLAWPVAVIERTRLRIVIFALAFLVHAGCGVVFYIYSQSNISDSAGYYYDELGFGREFGLATQLIYFIVQTLKSTIGGTFLDYFMIFQAFGFFGIAFLMRIFEEIYRELEIGQPLYVYLLLFLPGMHFWTSSIGKDGAIFSGVCLSLWAAMQVRQRYWWLALGILVVLLIRPHIALIMAAAIVATLLLDRASGLFARLLLVFAAVAGLAVAAATVQSTFSLDVTNADSVSDFLASREEVTQTSTDTGDTAVQGSLPVRFFSLLFRPFFLDAEGLFGYVASFENLILLLVILALLIRIRQTISVAKSLTFIRYAFVMSLGIAFVLSLVYYNVGLGLRQKMMFVPGILVIFVAVFAVRRARRYYASEGQASLLPQPSIRARRLDPAPQGRF